MYSPPGKNHGRVFDNAYRDAIETPGSEETSVGDVTIETPESALAQALRRKGTPKTVAPKITRIQREREKSKLPSGLHRSGDSRTTDGDTTTGDIILHLEADPESMNSSTFRKNSKGRIIKPTEDDDIFTAPPTQGKSLGWMYKRAKIGTPEAFPEGIDEDTPTRKRDPPSKASKALPKKGPAKKEPPKKDPPRKKKQLGVPFPNFGRLWCAKYGWEEVQGAYLVKMFEQCDPEDKSRVKELYELAWLIKVSTAMVQCDIQDQARVQQLVQWAQDFRRRNDWQCPVPLGWNLKQQQYTGPRPSDEERQRFVDYAWQMNQNQVTQTWDEAGKRKYDEAALEVFTFRNQYPDFPHDYPPGYPGENANYKSESLYRTLSHYSKFPAKEAQKKVEVTQESRDTKRKATAMEENVAQELPKKKTKVSVKTLAPAREAYVKPGRSRAITGADAKNPRRSGRKYQSPTHYGV